MSKITIKLDREEFKNNFPFFSITVDDMVIDYWLIPSGFYWSGHHEGNIPILRCGCGYVGCTGAYVKVVHDKEKIIWQRLFHGSAGGWEQDHTEEDYFPLWSRDEKHYADLPITFDKAQYLDEIDKMFKFPEFETHEKKEYEKDVANFKHGNFFKD